MESGDKNWAQSYLIDPLTAPQPSEETGPGTSFQPGASTAPPIFPQSPPTRSTSGKLTKNNPDRSSLDRKSVGSPTTSKINRSSSVKSNPAYPSPPPSASPHAGQSPNYRKDAFGDNTIARRRRGSSLNEKYPGDMSHRPLDQLTKEKAIADKSRHATRKHHIRPDSIDSLDGSSPSAYHHGGPYDATLYARNNTSNSPLQALAGSNSEALKATPREKIIDSIQGHRPLDGVAAYAPGETDRNGHVYRYEKGENMMVDNNPGGGAYKRWPGVQYHPDDIKGKGEPSYSIEKALKEHSPEDKGHRKSLGNEGIEMKNRSRSGSHRTGGDGWDDGENGVHRSDSFSQGLKKRIGSIKRHTHKDE